MRDARQAHCRLSQWLYHRFDLNLEVPWDWLHAQLKACHAAVKAWVQELSHG